MARIPVLIDGDLSLHLEKHAGEPIGDHPLWISRFLHTNRQACVSAHRDFIKVGAQIIRTNTYQASREGFTKYLNITDEEAASLINDSVNIVRKAIAEEKHPENIKVKIGGSLGSYGACLHDGSEYTGNYCDRVSPKEFKEWHTWRMKILVEAGVDLLIIETIPCSKEALAIIEVLKTFPNTKAWLSFSVKNATQISNGEDFAIAAQKCWESGKDQLVAVGVNCCKPQYVSPLFDSLIAKDPTIPFIAYPNNGESFDVGVNEWVEGDRVKHVSEYVGEWLNKGISYIGGCCRNSAEDLSKIRLALLNS